MTSAMTALQKNPVSIVLCECDVEPDIWKHILTVSVFLPTQPLLIVTSERADERLWMEAVECGAYDVLPKPFNIHELTRTVIFAWLRWKYSARVPSIAGAWGI